MRTHDKSTYEVGLPGAPANADSASVVKKFSWIRRNYGLIVALACSVFVFSVLHPSLILANTTTAGGDTGAHYIIPYFAWKDAFSHFQLAGWSRIWYRGFPLLTFYFPLPALLVDLTAFLVPYDIAFKLMTLSGSFALPPLMYWLGRSAKLREPYPVLLSLTSLAYLFDRSYTIDGGNIASTLAGEYSFSISLAFGIAFLSLVFSGLNSSKKIAGAAVLYALTALSHLLPAFFVALVAIIYVASGRKLKEFYKLAVAGVIGTVICAVWLIPFAVNIYYTSSMGWTKVTTYVSSLAPGELRVWLLLATLGVVLSVVKRRRFGITFAIVGLASVLAFVFLPQGAVYNARALPFYVLSVYVLAASGVAEAAFSLPRLLYALRNSGTRFSDPQFLGELEEGYTLVPRHEGKQVGRAGGQLTHDGAPGSGSSAETEAEEVNSSRDGSQTSGDAISNSILFQFAVDKRRSNILAVSVFMLAILLGVVAPLENLPSWLSSHISESFVPSWASWNYSGYEAKPGWPEYQRLMATMRSVGSQYGCGSAMWEYNANENQFGTPMALMLLPFWTGGCVDSMEGLFFESSATTPYHFLNQSELSQSPSDAMAGLAYSGLNVPLGVKHLQMLGVKYYMAFSPAVKSAASNDPNLRLVRTVKAVAPGESTSVLGQTWNIYKVLGTSLVQPLTHLPVVWKGMKGGSSTWLRYAQSWYLHPSQWSVYRAQNGPQSWRRVSPGAAVSAGARLPSMHVSSISSTTDTISFNVSRVGVPVVIRESYFPNWTATGADGPFRVTPNLMVVVPTTKHVTVRYSQLGMDKFSEILSVMAVVATMVVAWRWDEIIWRRIRRGRDQV